MKFKIKDSYGKIINAKCLYMFSNNNTGVNYIIYKTDDSDDILATRYNIENDEIKLMEIENDYEWDLIDQKIVEITGE